MTRLAENLATLPQTLERVARDRQPVIIQRDGHDLAAIIPVEDLALLERLREEEEDRLDAAEAEKAMEEYRRTGVSYPLSQVIKELGLEQPDDVSR